MPAVTTDPLVLEIIARTDKLERSVRSAQAKFTTDTDRMARASADMRKRIEANNGAIGTSFKGMAASLAAGLSVREIASMADSYTRFTNQLKVAGLEGQNLAGVQDKLFEVAQRNGVELESVGTLYSRAAQNQKELGASTSDLIGLTRAVAASLRISGTSTNEASGALMQLGQAFGSPRVQAEEFNSLLDTMQPLLREASKYIDGTGGSLAGLTRKIKDTNGAGVSNVQLFQAITRAMADLEKTAAGTALTIDGAFTNLSNAITKYIGQADQANGASAAVTAGLEALALNLDTVTEALGLLAAVMLGRYVAGMVAGATASAATGAAVFALQARAAGAATSMEALAFAGRAAGASMLAAFGGPVGLAVTALTVAVGYYVVKQQEAAKSGQALAAQTDIVAKYQADLNRILAADPSATNARNTNALAAAHRNAAKAAYEQANAELALQKNQAQQQLSLAQRGKRLENRGRAGNVEVDLDTQVTRAGSEKSRASNAAQKQLADLNNRQAQLDAAYKKALAAPKTPVIAPIAAAKPSSTKTKAAGASTSTPRSKDTDDQQAQALSRLVTEELAARLDLTTDTEKRAELQAQILAEERKARVAEVNKSADLSKAQKAAQIKAINKLYGEGEGAGGDITVSAGLYARRNARDQQEQLDRESLDALQAAARNEQDLLRAQADLTVTREARRDIELKLLDSAYAQERSELEAVIASKTAADALKKIAADRLAKLDQLKGYDAEKVNRQYESPLEAKRREVRTATVSMSDQIENLELDVIDRLTDGLADASTEFVKLGGVAGDVLNSIIRDFIKLAAQQAIFGGEGDTGGIISGVRKVLGFASGGYTGDGPKNQVAGVVHRGEYVVPAETVKRLGVQNLEGLANRRAAAGMATVSAVRPMQNTTIVSAPRFDLKGAVITPQLYADMQRISDESAARAGQAAYGQSMRDAPGAVRRAQRFRTT